MRCSVLLPYSRTLDWTAMVAYRRRPRAEIPGNRLPTDEELAAEGRVRFERLMAREGLVLADSECEGRWRIEREEWLAPPPLAWFRHAAAQRQPGPADPEHRYVRFMMHDRLAGAPDKPPPATVAAWMRDEELSDGRRRWLHELMMCVPPREWLRLRREEGFSVYDMARLAHLACLRTRRVSRLLERLALVPRDWNEPPVPMAYWMRPPNFDPFPDEATQRYDRSRCEGSGRDDRAPSALLDPSSA